MKFKIEQSNFDLMTEEGINKFTQVKSFLFLSTLMFFTSLINIFVILYTSNGDKSVYGIFFMTLGSLYFIYSIPRDHKIKLPKQILGFLVTILPVARLYFSGGVTSPAFFMLIPLIVFIFIGYGMKRGFMYGLYVLALYSYFYFYPPQVSFLSTPFFNLGMFFISILFLFGCLKIIIEKEKLLSSHLVAMEKRHASDEILAQLCHEINNPLNVIMGMTKISQDQQTRFETENLDENLTIIYDQSKRIDELVKKIKASVKASSN